MRLSNIALAITAIYGAFSPADLFANGEQGAWYDPSDYSTLFTDSAGTTPVTGVEQFVGLMLDKSGRGNHAFQSNNLKRPKLAARYNLLEYTEQFDNGYWTNNSRITANTAVAPDGTTTADTLTSNGTISNVSKSISATSGLSYTVSVSLKYTNNQWFLLQLSDNGTTHRARAWFDIQNGVLGTTATTGSGVVISSTIVPQGNGWYCCTLTATNPVTTLFFYPQLVDADGSTTAAANLQSCYIWGADLRPASQATGLIGPTYQRVAAATVYDTAGFLPYLAFDGLDDSMSTNSIDFSATDKMTVWAGVRKLSDAVAGIVAELSSVVTTNNGSFMLDAPDLTGANSDFAFYSKGTSLRGADSAALLSPISRVMTGIGDISGDVSTLRLNGIQVATNTGDQGIGNYGNYPLNIGARNNTSLFFNGWLTSLIVRGAQSTQSQIEATEAWVNGKTGAY
jgi:hypothetical protein